MNHGSLFSGIGGFDLAAEWMGWTNKFHCEWNPFGQKVLKHYWPEAESYTDITKTDFTLWRGKIDLISGGFPCQPYSQAGKRLGKEDDRHLWPEMLRAIREIQPRYVVGENVSGLVNWNGGMVFNEVQAELEDQGYQVTPFILPACGTNAPHRRDRIWFVAYSDSAGRKQSDKKMEGESSKQFNSVCIQQNDSNSGGERLQGSKYFRSTGEKGEKLLNKQSVRSFCDFREEYTFESPICNANNGFPQKLDGVTFSKWRTESIKAGGNAIVPQVAFQIFKAIGEFNKLLKVTDL